MSLKSVRRLKTGRWPQGKTPGKSIFALAALLAPLAFFSSAKAEVIVSRYYVSLAGMNLGGAIVHTALSEKRYKVAISADVGAVFINERVQGEATGSRAGAKLTPEHFTMVMSGSEDRAVEIHFAGSAPKSTKITPPLPPELASRRPPKEGDLRGVLDPFSALLSASLKLSPSGNPCNGVLPIYLGQARFDVSLHPMPKAGAQSASIVTCQARYAMAAGAAPAGGGYAGAQYLKPEVIFVRLSKPNLWLLQRLSLPTPFGTVIVDRAETAVSGS